MTASGAGLVLAVTSSHTPHLEGGQGAMGAMDKRWRMGARPCQPDKWPGPRTWLSSHRGHGSGRTSGWGWGSRLHPPPSAGEGENGKRKASSQRPKSGGTPGVVSGGLAVCVAAVPPRGSRTQLVAPGLAWAGATQGLSVAAGRDGGGGGYHPGGVTSSHPEHPPGGAAPQARLC